MINKMKNKKMKLIIILIAIIVFIVSLPINSKAITAEQQNKIANFARAFIEIGNEKQVLVYDQAKRIEGFNNQYSDDGKMHMDCSSFVAFVYNNTCDLGITAYTTNDFLEDTDTFTAVKEQSLYELKRDTTNLQLGDIVLVHGDYQHVGIYVGDGLIAHFANSYTGATISSMQVGFFNGTTGSASSGKTQETLNQEEKTVNTYILRLRNPIEDVTGFEEYVWPDGSDNATWVDEKLGNEFSYSGITHGKFGVKIYNWGWIINCLKEILNWFIGIVTYVIRILIVGWATFLEKLPENLVLITTDHEMSFTIDKLLFNKVPLLDVNIFNLQQAGGEALGPGDLLYIIRYNIATWYYIIRSIAIVGLLITLIYIGIRIAISSVAEQKAKYKNLLISWVVSFLIVFGMHYFMIGIISINETLLELIANMPMGETNLYDTVRVQAYEIPASIGWKAAIMYIILAILLLIYVVKYIKRFAVVIILTLLAPIIGIGYAIDKIKDNKSQYLNNWLKEYVINVIIQFVHALLYTIFVTIAFNMMGTSFMGVVMAVLLIIFMFKAEGIFKKIFGIKAATLKDLAVKNAFKLKANLKFAKTAMAANTKALGVAITPATAAADKIHTKNIENKLDKRDASNRNLLEIKNLEKELKSSAERRKEYRDNGFYDQEAMEAANYQKIASIISELKENQNTEDDKDYIKINGKEILKSDIDEIKDVLGEETSNKEIAKALYNQTGGNIINKASTGYRKAMAELQNQKKEIRGYMSDYKEEKRRLKLQQIASGKRKFHNAAGESLVDMATFGISGLRAQAKYVEQRHRESKNAEVKYEPVYEYIQTNNSKVGTRTIIQVLSTQIETEYKDLKSDKITAAESTEVIETSFNVLPEYYVESTLGEVIPEQESDKDVVITYKDLNKTINKIGDESRAFVNTEKLQEHVDSMLVNNIAKNKKIRPEDVSVNEINEELQRIGIEGISQIVKMASLNNDVVLSEEQLNNAKYKGILNKIEKLKKQQFIAGETDEMSYLKNAEDIVSEIKKKGKKNG